MADAIPAPPTSNIRRYVVEFADGKSCTALDMHAIPQAQAEKDIREQFQPGYVKSVTFMP
jgi:hypothetical protein